MQSDMASNAPLVTVVTPLYNTDAYLEVCIRSVLCQTYDNWEYVLVDNCSTDRSAEVAGRYANQYPGKIRLQHNTAFLSQVQNYNTALRAISPVSKYCKVVQADDWLFPDCLRSMVEIAEAHPRVGIVASYELEGDEVRLDGLPYPSPEVTGREASRQYFLRDKYLFGTPTSVLLRSDIVLSRDPFFDERYAPFEDAHACFDLLKTWNFGFVHQVLTYTRRDNESIISKVRPFGLELFLRFSTLVVHGRDYLSEDEYRRSLKQAERKYFSFLSSCACALHPQGRDFWEFHRKGLASVNYAHNWRFLAKWIPRALVEKLWFGAWNKWDRLAN
ncbi:MAG: glycosyltransferase family 2 protein [Terriglobales bacterium]